MITSLAKPLFAAAYGDLSDLLVHGAVALKLQGQNTQGQADFRFITRSLLSPWQFLVCELGGVESFWSVGLAYHSGQEIHWEALQSLSKVANAGEKELFCPRTYPLDWQESARLRLVQQRPQRMHHPCSGKHLLFLAACEAHGFSKDGYWESNHPLQKKLSAFIGREAREPVQTAYDKCGLPTFIMHARVYLEMWERLVLEPDTQVENMLRLWLEHPRLVGGRGRLDSELMLAVNGQLLVKEGSSGLLMVQSLPGRGEPVAGCLIKLAAGYNKSHLALALLTVIKAHPDLPEPFQLLREYLQGRMDEWLPRGYSLLEPPFL